MDYADNFTPKPIRGEKYTTTNGKVVIVDEILSDDGVVCVFCHYEGDDPNTMFPNKEEWEAMFSPTDDAMCSIQLSANPSDGGSVIGGGLYPKNTTVKLSAVPSNGFLFEKWSDDNIQMQRDYVVKEDIRLEAVFTQKAPGNSTDGGNASTDHFGGASPGGGSTTQNDASADSVNENANSDGANREDPTLQNPNDNGDFNEYLSKVLEPIIRLRNLLQNGITLPFQILKLETDEEIPAQFSDPNVKNTCQEEINNIEALRREGEKEANRGSWLEEKMWSFGAFDKPMLRMLKQDHGAKTGLGAAIFMTSLLAFCTGTYAFYKISNNTFLSFIIGLVWGTMIYVLDRNIVASMAYTGEKHRVRQLCMTVGMRLLISIFIGVVISTPIEMLIFSGKIDEFKEFEHEQFVKNEIASYQYEISKDLEAQKERIAVELHDIQQLMEKEAADSSAKGRGPRWNSYYAREKLIMERADKNQYELDNVHSIIEAKRKEFQDKAEKKWKRHEEFFDLSTDLAILYKVTSTVEDLDVITRRDSVNGDKSQSVGSSRRQNDASAAQKSNKTIDNRHKASRHDASTTTNEEVVNPALPKDNTMFFCRIFITVFFVLLEVIPVITKLFFKPGDYDKKMVRWAYLIAKLHRIENASSYSQTMNGALSRHRKYILGDEFEEIEKVLQSDEYHENINSEDMNNISLPIKGCLRTAKDINDRMNLNRWKFAIMKADKYLEEEINKLFSQGTSTGPGPKLGQPKPQNPSSSSDPSAGGEAID